MDCNCYPSRNLNFAVVLPTSVVLEIDNHLNGPYCDTIKTLEAAFVPQEVTVLLVIIVHEQNISKSMQSSQATPPQNDEYLYWSCPILRK